MACMGQSIRYLGTKILFSYLSYLFEFSSFFYLYNLFDNWETQRRKKKKDFPHPFYFFWLVCSNKMVKITLTRSCASLSLSGPFSSLIGSLSCMVVWLHELHSLYSLHMSDLFIYLFIHTFPYPLLEILHGIILF